MPLMTKLNILSATDSARRHILERFAGSLVPYLNSAHCRNFFGSDATSLSVDLKVEYFVVTHSLIEFFVMDSL